MLSNHGLPRRKRRGQHGGKGCGAAIHDLCRFHPENASAAEGIGGGSGELLQEKSWFRMLDVIDSR